MLEVQIQILNFQKAKLKLSKNLRVKISNIVYIYIYVRGIDPNFELLESKIKIIQKFKGENFKYSLCVYIYIYILQEPKNAKPTQNSGVRFFRPSAINLLEYGLARSTLMHNYDPARALIELEH